MEESESAFLQAKRYAFESTSPRFDVGQWPVASSLRVSELGAISKACIRGDSSVCAGTINSTERAWGMGTEASIWSPTHS